MSSRLQSPLAARASSQAELARIETVLDYHLFIVDESHDVAGRDESARVGLDHAIRLVQAQAAALRRFIAAGSTLMDKLGAEVEARLVEATRPEEVIMRIAADEGFDLIMVGSSLRAVPTRAFFGHRVESILRSATCPVAVLSVG